MQTVYIELRADAAPPSVDLARHMYTRLMPGTLVIIADRPLALLAALRKQWHKVLRQVAVERSRTLSAVRILELSRTHLTMQRLRFTSQPPGNEPEAEVYLIQPAEIAALPANFCHTAYASCPLGTQQLDQLSGKIRHHGLLVVRAKDGPAPDEADAQAIRMLPVCSAAGLPSSNNAINRAG